MSTPMACDMSALTPTERDEHARVAAELRQRVSAVEERPDGYTLVAPLGEGTLHDLATFVALERRCCPFITFTLHIPSSPDIAHLSLTGEEGIKPFLREELGL